MCFHNSILASCGSCWQKGSICFSDFSCLFITFYELCSCLICLNIFSDINIWAYKKKKKKKKKENFNHPSAWVFSCKFAAHFQNTFSQEHLWTGRLLLKISFSILLSEKIQGFRIIFPTEGVEVTNKILLAKL